MDLFATGQMMDHVTTYGDWDVIKDKQNIEIPRMRGYRFMAGEKPISEKEIRRAIRKERTYLINDAKFDRKMGWGGYLDKRQIRSRVRRFAKRAYEQYEMFSKYAGRKDVIMVHSRAGSSWDWQRDGVGPSLERNPSYLGRVLDCYDPTYCDIYIRIMEDEKNERVSDKDNARRLPHFP